MPREFPDRVNPWTAAEGSRIYSGTMPLLRMKRLIPLLVSTEGVARFEAEFRIDEEKRAIIKLDVNADVSLLCQRSLLPYFERIERNTLLAVIEDEAEQSLLPGHYEATMADHGRVSFEMLVEDEMLLGLPQVPRNPDVAAVEYQSGPQSASSADGGGDDRQEKPTGPFAELAQLLPDAGKD